MERENTNYAFVFSTLQEWTQKKRRPSPYSDTGLPQPLIPYGGSALVVHTPTGIRIARKKLWFEVVVRVRDLSRKDAFYAKCAAKIDIIIYIGKEKRYFLLKYCFFLFLFVPLRPYKQTTDNG